MLLMMRRDVKNKAVLRACMLQCAVRGVVISHEVIKDPSRTSTRAFFTFRPTYDSHGAVGSRLKV